MKLPSEEPPAGPSPAPAGAHPEWGWTANEPGRGLRRLDLMEVWRYRELAYFFALRDVKARYKQAAFGIAWAVIQPMVVVSVFLLVFNTLGGVSAQSGSYLVFALCGTVIWTYMSGTIVAATNSLVENASLVTKVYFPRLLAPLSSALPGLIALGIGLALGLAVATVQGAPLRLVALATVPLMVIWGMVASLGPGLALATLNVRYRDVAAIQSVLLQLWLLVTPVAYPSSLVPDAWLPLYALNPLAGPTEGFRWALTGEPLDPTLVSVSLCSAAVVLCLALWQFQRTERAFADVI